MDIVKNFTNVRIFEHDFIGFGPLKNLALEKAGVANNSGLIHNSQ